MQLKHHQDGYRYTPANHQSRNNTDPHAKPEAGTSRGASLSQFVKDEFDAFLACGMLAQGFLRVRCADCGHDKLVGFSCKRRGFCPSCGARRRAQIAAHLVEHVIPRVPVRQWVLSLPCPTRVPLAAQPVLKAPPAWWPSVPQQHLYAIRKPCSEMTGP